MTFKLLLDAHISPKVAAALRRQFPGLDVKSILDTDWAALADQALLELLDQEGRVLVTRDANTVPVHCKARLGGGQDVCRGDLRRQQETAANQPARPHPAVGGSGEKARE